MPLIVHDTNKKVWAENVAQLIRGFGIVGRPGFKLAPHKLGLVALEK